MADNLGSVRDVVQYNASTGNTDILDHILYDAFGNVVSQTDAADQPAFLFAGEMYDSNTGLYYDHERWYDPETGDFISQDPLGFAAGDSNLNRYVGNNVTSLTDPSGMAPAAGHWELFQDPGGRALQETVPVQLNAARPPAPNAGQPDSGDDVGVIHSNSGGASPGYNPRSVRASAWDIYWGERGFWKDSLIMPWNNTSEVDAGDTALKWGKWGGEATAVTAGTAAAALTYASAAAAAAAAAARAQQIAGA